MFEKIKLFRNQMEVLLPIGFCEMPDYIARKKYPSKYRPPVILMDKDNLVNFTFNLTQTPLVESQFQKAAEGFEKTFRQTYPNAKFQELWHMKGKGEQLAILPYESMAMDVDLFNIAFFTSVKNKVLCGSFNCILDMKGSWEETAIHCISSIQEIKEEKDEGSSY